MARVCRHLLTTREFFSRLDEFSNRISSHVGETVAALALVASAPSATVLVVTSIAM